VYARYDYVAMQQWITYYFWPTDFGLPVAKEMLSAQ